MATNSIIAKGGVIHVPPISLAFYRWFFVFLILLPFVATSILENRNYLIKESKQLFFLGFVGCGICGAFPFLAGLTTTVTNIGIIYTSSPIFIILISSIFFKEKIFRMQIYGLALCLVGVFLIIMKGKISLPYYRSMVCAIRCSKKLLDLIFSYALKYKTLFFCEVMFNTIALHNNLNIADIKELKTISWNNVIGQNEININNLYHPIKSISEQYRLRKLNN